MSERTAFLYPFIDSEERDAETLLRDLAASARAKLDISHAARRSAIDATAESRQLVASAMTARLRRGGRLLVFGNGGSSTDAASLAALFSAPPWGRPLPALDLGRDPAVLTALANDVGFDLVFSRQLIAHGRPTDIALGLSTSGNSPNLLLAFREASSRGVLTVGIAGYGGGAMRESPDVAHCLAVNADSVHRIQEAQAAVGFALWEAVQAATAAATTTAEAAPGRMPRPAGSGREGGE